MVRKDEVSLGLAYASMVILTCQLVIFPLLGFAGYLTWRARLYSLRDGIQLAVRFHVATVIGGYSNRRTPHRRRPRRTFSSGFSSCHFTWARQSYMVHHRACGDLTEIQIAIWSPDETQYCSVRSWQTPHYPTSAYQTLLPPPSTQSEELYLPLPLLCVLRVDRGCIVGNFR